MQSLNVPRLPMCRGVMGSGIPISSLSDKMGAIKHRLVLRGLFVGVAGTIKESIPANSIEDRKPKVAELNKLLKF